MWQINRSIDGHPITYCGEIIGKKQLLATLIKYEEIIQRTLTDQKVFAKTVKEQNNETKALLSAILGALDHDQPHKAKEWANEELQKKGFDDE